MKAGTLVQFCSFNRNTAEIAVKNHLKWVLQMERMGGNRKTTCEVRGLLDKQGMIMLQWGKVGKNGTECVSHPHL